MAASNKSCQDLALLTPYYIPQSLRRSNHILSRELCSSINSMLVYNDHKGRRGYSHEPSTLPTAQAPTKIRT